MRELLHHVAIDCNTARSDIAATLCSMTIDQRMRSAQGERLMIARKAAGYPSMNAASEANGWPSSTYRAHETGKRTMGQDDAERYARRFKTLGARVTAKWILFGDGGEPEHSPEHTEIVRVPLVSWVSASMLAETETIVSHFDGRRIPVCDLPSGEWIALKVCGDSMDRVAPDGSVIYLNLLDKKLVRNGLYVFSERGEATFKRFIDKPVQRLEPYSTNPIHEPIYPRRELTVVGRVRRVVFDMF